MFSNIGRKIQVAGKVFCWIGILLSLVGGVMVWFTFIASGQLPDAMAVISGILTVIIGALLSWVGSFTMIGFGKLVENSEIIAANVTRSQF